LLAVHLVIYLRGKHKREAKNLYSILSQVQNQIADLKEEVAEQVNTLDNKITESIFATEPAPEEPLHNTTELAPASATTNRQILEIKDRIHRNSNLLRFLISEPLSVQFSVWRRGEAAAGRAGGGGGGQCLTFNWVNHNAGGAVDDGKF
jgi:hypothetical protein